MRHGLCLGRRSPPSMPRSSDHIHDGGSGVRRHPRLVGGSIAKPFIVQFNDDRGGGVCSCAADGCGTADTVHKRADGATGAKNVAAAHGLPGTKRNGSPSRVTRAHCNLFGAVQQQKQTAVVQPSDRRVRSLGFVASSVRSLRLCPTRRRSVRTIRTTTRPRFQRRPSPAGPMCDAAYSRRPRGRECGYPPPARWDRRSMLKLGGLFCAAADASHRWTDPPPLSAGEQRLRAHAQSRPLRGASRPAKTTSSNTRDLFFRVRAHRDWHSRGDRLALPRRSGRRPGGANLCWYMSYNRIAANVTVGSTTR